MDKSIVVIDRDAGVDEAVLEALRSSGFIVILAKAGSRVHVLPAPAAANGHAKKKRGT
jgi:hypothetical protein